MVSKEPDHSLTSHTNSKSALADKLPGTMTVRSVLLNRDSPDIESRLKRRRNRTHQVRFKDLEDSSSSSGNGGGTSGGAKSHQRSATEHDSPHPIRKHSGAAPKGWTARDGLLGTDALPGRTSVVGAVRGDMAGTIEVVAAFLARAPPHPLTPGPTRRCWAPPQTNSLTLPMTHKSSTSTAIQTSPRLKKPQPPSLTRHPRSHSLGDSVGVDGDDERDSQDECHNHVSLPGSKEENGLPGDRRAVEWRVKAMKAEDKAAVGVNKSSRHSCPPSAAHHPEPRYCSSVLGRDASKRQGSTTPSLVRRRKRLNRTISDPGKEVSYCTTPTQTESSCPSPPPSNTQDCTAQVQSEHLCRFPPPHSKHYTTDSIQSPPPNGKHYTTQRPSSAPNSKPYATQSPTPNVKRRTTQIQAESPYPPPPPNSRDRTTHIQTESLFTSTPPNTGHCTTQMQTETPNPSPPPCPAQTQIDSPCASSPPSVRPNPTHIHSRIPSKYQTVTPDPCSTQIKTVPYCASPPATAQPCATPPCPSPPRARSPLADSVLPAGLPNKCSPPPPPSVPTSSSASAISSCTTSTPPTALTPPALTASTPTLPTAPTAHVPTAPTTHVPTAPTAHVPTAPTAHVPTAPTPTAPTAPNLTPPTALTPTAPTAPTPTPTLPTAPAATPPTAALPCAPPTPAAVTPNSVPYYTVSSPPATLGTAAAVTPRKTTPCTAQSGGKSFSNTAPCIQFCSSLTPTTATATTPNGPVRPPATACNANTTYPLTAPAVDVTPCTFVTQTALSCTSISYYTTTLPTGPPGQHFNSTPPPYTTVIQTVSHCNIPCPGVQNIPSASPEVALYSNLVAKHNLCASSPPIVRTLASALQNMQSCATTTKAVPLYSSTFRAAPPYTPPAQAPYNTQEKRGIRLPPPPPPPPPYTPRKEGSVTPAPAHRPPTLRADSKAGDEDKGGEKEGKGGTAPPPVTVMKGQQQVSPSPAKTCSKPICLSSAQAQLGALHKMLCSGPRARPGTPNSQHALTASQQGCPGAWGCSGSVERPAAGFLTSAQADTLRQVQEILGGLVSGAKCKLDPARVTEKLLGPNGPLHDIRSLQTQLQSLEGVLETSQHTIKVLLDVIQDLEKKEAERDGRHSYRTGQDIENCGTCRDCACIIYSVEHDFRLQEGQVVRTWKVGDPPEGSPRAASPQQPATPHRQDSPQPVRPPAATKKNRKKCFWFL